MSSEEMPSHGIRGRQGTVAGAGQHESTRRFFDLLASYR
jgi:hypothetical protein